MSHRKPLLAGAAQLPRWPPYHPASSPPTIARRPSRPSTTKPTSPTSTPSSATTSGEPASTPPRKVTLILCVDPLLEPANGPTLFPFDPGILYEIKVDNNNDAVADVTFQFRFAPSTAARRVHRGRRASDDAGAFDPDDRRTSVVPPRITTFDNPGLNQRQTLHRHAWSARARRDPARTTTARRSSPFPATPVPAPWTTRRCSPRAPTGFASGIKVFAGTTDDAFWIDLGATFDTANFRTLGSGVPGVLTAAEDAAAAELRERHRLRLRRQHHRDRGARSRC